MQKCSEKAYAMCPTRRLCGAREEATFMESSQCADFNKSVEDKPMTNADRIRAMSDAEMAEWLARTQVANVTEALSFLHMTYSVDDESKAEIKKECLQWLQQPAEES